MARPQDDAFISALVDDPENDGLRLIYSDWLDEHGKPEQAEFLRLDCALRGRTGEGDSQLALGDRWRTLLRILPKGWTSKVGRWQQSRTPGELIEAVRFGRLDGGERQASILALLELAACGDARAARSVLEPPALLDRFIDYEGHEYVASMASILEAHAPTLEADTLWVLAAHEVDSPAAGPTDPREVGEGLRVAALHALLRRWLGPEHGLRDVNHIIFFEDIARELARLRPLSPEQAETLAERYAGVCEALAGWPGTTEEVAVYDYLVEKVETLSSWLLRLPAAAHEVVTFVLHERCAAVTDWCALCQCSEFIDSIANPGSWSSDRPSFIVPETGRWILFPSYEGRWVFRGRIGPPEER